MICQLKKFVNMHVPYNLFSAMHLQMQIIKKIQLLNYYQDLQIVVQDLVNRMNDRDLKDSNILERLERVERFMERFSKNVKKSAKKTSQKKSSTIANLKTGNHGDIASTSQLKFDPCDSGYSHAEVQNFILWQQAAKVLEP